MNPAEKQRLLAEDLSIIPDRQERLAIIVDRVRHVGCLQSFEKTAAHRVEGCVSSVWLVCDSREDRLYFRSDADSPLVKGLVALLCDVYDGGLPAEIVATEPDIFEKLDLLHDLSPTRQNGLAAVRACIRDHARHHLISG